MSNQHVQSLCLCIPSQMGPPHQYPASYSGKEKESYPFLLCFFTSHRASSPVTPKSFIDMSLPFLFLLWLLLLKFLPSFAWTAVEELDGLDSSLLLSQLFFILLLVIMYFFFLMLFLFIYFVLFLAVLHGLRNLRSPTRDRTCAIGSDGVESFLTTGRPGNSL